MNRWKTFFFNPLLLGTIVALFLPAITPSAWTGRLLGIGILVYLLPPYLLYKAVSPKTQFYKPGRSALKPKDPGKARRMNTIIGRAALYLAIVVILLLFTIPVTRDLIDLQKSKPVAFREVHKVKSFTSAFGTRFLYQGLRLEDMEGSYSFFFLGSPVRTDTFYEFMILPRSQLILDARPANTINPTSP